MNLKSMTDFGLNQFKDYGTGKINSETFIHSIYSYAKFLKQPLKLGMFIPCDESGSILKEPKKIVFQDAHFDIDEMNNYHKAKERVLFKGFEILNDNTSISKGAKFLSNENLIIAYKDSEYSEWKFDKFKTIESMCLFEVEVTESVIKHFKY